MGAACAVGSRQGARKKQTAQNLNCAPCSVDTRLGRPAYHGRLSPAMREKRERESSHLSRLIPTASSTPAWTRAWGAPAPRHPVPAPRSSGPSHTVRVGRPVQTEQNRTNIVPTPSHGPGQSRGRLRELWPMTSRTQLPIEVLPNQTGRCTPPPQPEPASPLPVTRLGHQHAFVSAILVRAAPRRPNLAPSPELGRYMESCSTTSTPTKIPVHGVAARFHQFCCFCPAMAAMALAPIPISNPIPAQPRSGPVCFFALSYRLLSMDGLDGLMRDFFSLVPRTPSLPT